MEALSLASPEGALDLTSLHREMKSDPAFALLEP
jgi:hypothetical protein